MNEESYEQMFFRVWKFDGNKSKNKRFPHREFALNFHNTNLFLDLSFCLIRMNHPKSTINTVMTCVREVDFVFIQLRLHSLIGVNRAFCLC